MSFLDNAMEVFYSFLDSANTFLYSKFLIVLLVLCGLYFSVRTGFVQLRLLPDAIRIVGEKSDEGDLLISESHALERGAQKTRVSSFQALMISTASRVGIGNIAGVATAISLGGAGAVFWMWAMAVIGGASAFIESTLAQVYKVKAKKGFRGGPAYYIQQALGQRWLGIVFAVLLIACFAYGFNGLQAFTVSSAFAHYVGAGFADSKAPIIVGLILAGATGAVIFGGAHRIGVITSIVVPIMAGVYILLGLFITIKNIGMLPDIFRDIFAYAFDFKGMFQDAFDFQSIMAAFAGSCIVIGIKRGLFSNEAGMGSAPNAAAAAHVSHPAKQGLVQTLSVFIDTILICSTTAFVVLISGTAGGGLTALPLVQASVSSQVGEWGIHFITFSICLFAFTSLVGNYYYAESNLMFIKDSKNLLFFFRITVVLMVFCGAQLNLETAWNLADVLMGGMATVNLISILLLGGIAVRVLRDYEKQKREGLDPVFWAKNVGLHNTEFWK